MLELAEGQFKDGSLYKHLHGLQYRFNPDECQSEAISQGAKVPLYIPCKKRKSGRNTKPGRSNWLPWRGDAPVGSDKWPSNWDAIPAWREAQNSQ